MNKKSNGKEVCRQPQQAGLLTNQKMPRTFQDVDSQPGHKASSQAGGRGVPARFSAHFHPFRSRWIDDFRLGHYRQGRGAGKRKRERALWRRDHLDVLSAFGAPFPVEPRTFPERPAPLTGRGQVQGRLSGFGLVLSQLKRITPYLWESVNIPKATSTVLKESIVSEFVQLPR